MHGYGCSDYRLTLTGDICDSENPSQMSIIPVSKIQIRNGADLYSTSTCHINPLLL